MMQENQTQPDKNAPLGSLLEKDHDFREGKTYNKLTVTLICPYNEAIIDENRIETALRNAMAVPDLEVQTVEFRING